MIISDTTLAELDNMTPSQRMNLFQKNCSVSSVCSLEEIILITLYIMDKVFAGNKYVYIKGDQSVYKIITAAYPSLSLFKLQEAMLNLDLAKVIYRFTCAKKFNITDSSEKQLRINSWGRLYVEENSLETSGPYNILSQLIESEHQKNYHLYASLLNAVLSDTIHSSEINQLNSIVNIQLLS